MKIVKVFLILASAVIFIISCADAENQQTETSQQNTAQTVKNTNETVPTETPIRIKSGKDIYSESCAECHKADGTGGKTEVDGKMINAHSLVSAGAKKDSDEDFIKYISDGFPEDGMPAFKDKLSTEEIKSVIKYIREELQKS
ncbi:MAG: cytochrome c [Pyrinomonadaceae bacterium]